jgi:hypothetical protein
MPFGLTNAPAIFQSYIDDLGVCYLGKVLSYSGNEMEHEEYLHQVLQRLKKFGLYCKAEKCQFEVLEVGFLGFVITCNEVGMESDQISTIDDWHTPKSGKEVQVLPGFTNIFQRFIQKYALVTVELTELVKKPETSPRGKNGTHPAKSEWTRQAEVAFRKLKRTFTKAPILQQFNMAKAILLQIDSS